MTTLQHRLKLLKDTLTELDLMRFVVVKPDSGTSVDYDGLEKNGLGAGHCALVGAYVALLDLQEMGYD